MTTETHTHTDDQPCPFCGERRIAHQYRFGDKEVRLSCANPACIMRVFTPWLPSLRAAVEAWNTRLPAAAAGDD